MYRDWLLPRKKNRKNKNLSLVVKYIKKTEMWNINITYRGQTGILKKHKQFPYENKVWPPGTPKKKNKNGIMCQTYRDQTDQLKKHKQNLYKNKVWPPGGPD